MQKDDGASLHGTFDALRLLVKHALRGQLPSESSSSGARRQEKRLLRLFHLHPMGPLKDRKSEPEMLIAAAAGPTGYQKLFVSAVRICVCSGTNCLLGVFSSVFIVLVELCLFHLQLRSNA